MKKLDHKVGGMRHEVYRRVFRLKMIKCKYCGEEFSSWIKMYRHVECVHYKVVLTCEICGKEFKTKKQLSLHVANNKNHPDTIEYYRIYPINKNILDDIFKQMIDSRMIIDNATKCWNWIGNKDKDGYGKYCSKRIHRIVYTVYKGKIGKGLLVCHSCDNPSCINPNHLWLGDNNDNMKDMVKKGRSLSGLENPSSNMIIRGKISEKNIGKNNPCYGKSISEETRNKMSISHRGSKKHKRPVIIGDVYYKTIREASLEIGMSYKSIVRRIEWGLNGYSDA